MYSSHSCINLLVFSRDPSKAVGVAIAGPFPLLPDMFDSGVEGLGEVLTLGAVFLIKVVGLGGPSRSVSSVSGRINRFDPGALCLFLERGLVGVLGACCGSGAKKSFLGVLALTRVKGLSGLVS